MKTKSVIISGIDNNVDNIIVKTFSLTTNLWARQGDGKTEK